jgi:hypothetical protein
MEGKTGNLINDNWNSKINVAPNYDATLPKMDIQIINNYFNINANKEISTIDGNNGNNVINTGKYNNMPNYIIDNMNTKQVDKVNIAAQEKFIKEFSIINKDKLAEKSISEILNIMASQQAVMKPIIGTIQINLKSNYVGIKTSLYIDKFWKEWNVDCNICYKIMWILKLLNDINVKEIKLLVEKYSIYAIYTKFKIIGLNIDTMECTNENIWEIIYIKDKIKIHLKLKMEYDLFQMEEMKIQLMVLIIQNKYQVIQQMDYYGKDEQENSKWLVNKEYIKIKIQV